MAVNLSTFESTLQTKFNNVTDPKEMLLLGKALEATIGNQTVSDVQAEGATQVGLVQTEGTTQVAVVTAEGATQVAAVQAAAGTAVTQTDIDNSIAALVDSAPATLDTLNELAAALGDDPNFSTTVTNNIASKLPVTGGTMTGTLTVPKVVVNGALDIEEVVEKVNTSASTSGTVTFDATAQGIVYFTQNQTADRTVNFTNVNSSLATGQSVTASILCAQGSTAYYLNAYQVDGSAVTPKWQGGAAPTAGNASGIDVYTFTIIKTANATFTVLASQTQFA
jgi:hypothetical protein